MVARGVTRPGSWGLRFAVFGGDFVLQIGVLPQGANRRGPALPRGPSLSWSISRILSLSSHPSAPISRGGPVLAGPAADLGLGGQRRRPCLALHRVGFAWPARHRAAGALLPHHFTLAGGEAHVRPRRLGGLFLWHFPAGFPGSVPRPPCPAVSGLSSKAGFLSSPRDCLTSTVESRRGWGLDPVPANL